MDSALTMRLLRNRATVVVCSLFPVALLYSPTLLTLVQIALFALAWAEQWARTRPTHRATDFWAQCRNFAQRKDYLSFTVIFAVVLLSLAYTDDYPTYWERLRIKLPLLVMPWVFWALPPLAKTDIGRVLTVVLAVLTLQSVAISADFALHWKIRLDAIAIGQSLPTPMHHIRYSLLCVMAVLSGLWLYQHGVWKNHRAAQTAIILATMFLIAFVHLQGVRSGWLALYAGLGVAGIHYIIRTRRYILLIALFAGGLALPVAAYFALPSVQTKINYTIYDWQHFQRGEVANFSDGQRWLSYQAGITIGNRSPWWGVGYGDVQQEVWAYYDQCCPDLPKRILPHNQFLYWYVASGAIGLLVMTLAFCYPIGDKRHRRNAFLHTSYAVIFVSMLPENTLETAVGTAIYLFFCLLSIKMEETK